MREVRRYRKQGGRLGVTRSFYLPADLLQMVEREAEEEGHHNFSTVVTQALTEHFARRAGDREEAIA